jgi:aryl-alcohol dehydrogenase-like predicted oxidoreductase
MFLAGAAALTSQISLRRAALAASPGELPKRRLGRTNAMVSMVGMGGFHIGKADMPSGDAVSLIHAGIDRGITFLDNSWDYNGGNSELRMGQALDVGGYREKVFLMTKIDGRTKSAAQQQIDQSLSRLLCDRSARRSSQSGQDPIHRLYRSQVTRLSFAHDRRRAEKRLYVRYGADAAQRYGCALRKF